MNDGDEFFADFLEMRSVEADVRLHAGPRFDSIEMFIEVFVGDAERDLSEELDESTISIVSKSFVARLLDQASQCFIVQAKIENGVHHAWHRHCRTRAN